MTIDLASLQSRDGARRTRLAINHQARSAVMCSASRMKGEQHPAKIVRPEAYLFILHLMRAYNVLLYFLVSPLPEIVMAYTLHHGCLTIGDAVSG